VHKDDEHLRGRQRLQKGPVVGVRSGQELLVVEHAQLGLGLVSVRPAALRRVRVAFAVALQERPPHAQEAAAQGPRVQPARALVLVAVVVAVVVVVAVLAAALVAAAAALSAAAAAARARSRVGSIGRREGARGRGGGGGSGRAQRPDR
jgi:hypothetical protein